MRERMCCHINCICSAFLCSVFSNVSSNYLPLRMHIHIGCICMVFLQNELAYVSSSCLPEQMQSYIGCICVISLQCDFLSVYLKCLPALMQNHIGRICKIFSIMSFHMTSQRAMLSRCTLVTLVRPLSSMIIHMFLEGGCVN